VFRERADGSSCRLCCEFVNLDRATQSAVRIRLEDPVAGAPGRLYIEIYAADRPLRLDKISWSTSTEPLREVSLGVAICSYNRAASVLRTVEGLARVAPDASISKIVVVNQGEPLDSSRFRDLQKRQYRLLQGNRATE